MTGLITQSNGSLKQATSQAALVYQENPMLIDFRDEYERYKLAGEKALAQVPETAWHRTLGGADNSLATLIRHISGNLRSRFTDFLTSDGEKPWRDRDSEFTETAETRQQLEDRWAQGWAVLFETLTAMTDADLGRQVTIRGVPLTVHEALCRSLAHTASHIGQIILLARVFCEGEWQSLSIPKGQSQQYNQNPTQEKRPH
jgi:hypothetical protein